MAFVYALEQRNTKETDFSATFVGSSEEQCIRFMKNNLDYDSRETDWWWAIVGHEVDHDIFNDIIIDGSGEVVNFYSWDGDLLQYQPLSGYRAYKINMLMAPFVETSGIK